MEGKLRPFCFSVNGRVKMLRLVRGVLRGSDHAGAVAPKWAPPLAVALPRPWRRALRPAPRGKARKRPCRPRLPAHPESSASLGEEPPRPALPLQWGSPRSQELKTHKRPKLGPVPNVLTAGKQRDRTQLQANRGHFAASGRAEAGSLVLERGTRERNLEEGGPALWGSEKSS